MGQNAELDAGSRAVGGTVSLPLGSFLLRCLRYILENWPVHSFNPAPWSKLPGVSAGGRDAQGLIWVCALIQGVASGSARSPGGAEEPGEDLSEQVQGVRTSTPHECPLESVLRKGSFSLRKWKTLCCLPASSHLPGACSVGPPEMVLAAGWGKQVAQPRGLLHRRSVHGHSWVPRRPSEAHAKPQYGTLLQGRSDDNKTF